MSGKTAQAERSSEGLVLANRNMLKVKVRYGLLLVFFYTGLFKTGVMNLHLFWHRTLML